MGALTSHAVTWCQFWIQPGAFTTRDGLSPPFWSVHNNHVGYLGSIKGGALYPSVSLPFLSPVLPSLPSLHSFPYFFLEKQAPFNTARGSVGCESACTLLLSTSTIVVYYYSVSPKADIHFYRQTDVYFVQPCARSFVWEYILGVFNS